MSIRTVFVVLYVYTAPLQVWSLEDRGPVFAEGIGEPPEHSKEDNGVLHFKESVFFLYIKIYQIFLCC